MVIEIFIFYISGLQWIVLRMGCIQWMWGNIDICRKSKGPGRNCEGFKVSIIENLLQPFMNVPSCSIDILASFTNLHLPAVSIHPTHLREFVEVHWDDIQFRRVANSDSSWTSRNRRILSFPLRYSWNWLVCIPMVQSISKYSGRIWHMPFNICFMSDNSSRSIWIGSID